MKDSKRMAKEMVMGYCISRQEGIIRDIGKTIK